MVQILRHKDRVLQIWEFASSRFLSMLVLERYAKFEDFSEDANGKNFTLTLQHISVEATGIKPHRIPIPVDVLDEAYLNIPIE